MLDFNKRRILDICKERVPNLELNEDFTNKSRNDVTNEMFTLGADISSILYSHIDISRYERYFK